MRIDTLVLLERTDPEHVVSDDDADLIADMWSLAATALTNRRVTVTL